MQLRALDDADASRRDNSTAARILESASTESSSGDIPFVLSCIRENVCAIEIALAEMS